MVNKSMTFYKHFPNLEIDANKSQERFTIRMLYFLMSKYPAIYDFEFKAISTALGQIIISRAEIEAIFLKDFPTTLYMLFQIYDRLSRGEITIGTITPSSLSNKIQKELEAADIDLGIDWRDGEFIPRGARLLDEKLIDDPLEWIKENDLPTVYEPLTKALDHLLRARKDPRLLNDVITDVYEALESMAKIVCDKDKKFDANRELFIKKINASQNYKKLAKEISEYAHEFRHGLGKTKQKPKPTYDEVESFLYIVGVLIRLGTKTLEQQ